MFWYGFATARTGFLQQRSADDFSMTLRHTDMSRIGSEQMSQITDGSLPFRVGAWLPSDKAVLDEWLRNLAAVAEQSKALLQDPVKDLQDLIEADGGVYMAFHQMFTQVPFKYSPEHSPQVKNYKQMLAMINHIIGTAPEYSRISDRAGLIGFPINAILDWSMGTQAGFWAFTNEKVNAALKKILNTWAHYLSSPDSQYVLVETRLENPRGTTPGHEKWGWFCEDALTALAHADPYYGIGDNPLVPRKNFCYNFQCRPDQPHWGFASWDDFFTRQFREGRRPVASPENDNVIANACESAPYKIARNVKRRDRFWIKAQPYSLTHMLGSDELANDFVGGTVYQAFLSAKSYHRWHSPVSGTITKVLHLDGTYYSETLAEGYDAAGPNESQGYITEVAARALICIQADNPAIGRMCALFVGMAEVSSCEVTVTEGQHVDKGDELGMFHFGGSTHCLIFGPEVSIAFDLHGQKPGLASSNIPLRTRIAEVGD